VGAPGLGCSTQHEATSSVGSPAGVTTHPVSPPPLSRSWVNLYCVLSKGDLGFYKDAKGQAAGSTHGGEPLLNLHNSTSEVASDYKKKKNVFKLKYIGVLTRGGSPQILGDGGGGR